MILPRWLLRTSWALHRGVHAASGGRLGTMSPSANRVGTLFLLTTGRRTGTIRRNGLFFIEDGSNLVVVASNVGADTDPAWWLNLQAHPDATVELGGRRRQVRAREATPDEEARLWPRLVQRHSTFAEYRRATTRPISIVVLEPLG